jgi:hypothetical protein
MANHDLLCPACGRIYVDVNIPITLGATKYCADTWCQCHAATLEPIPAIRLSLFSDGDSKSGPSDFTKFTTQIETPDGGFRDVTVSSLRDIRKLERESEQAERNGEGRRMIWRSYAQDRSNEDVHTMGPDPSMKPNRTLLNGQPLQIRKGDPVIADHGTIPDE